MSGRVLLLTLVLSGPYLSMSGCMSAEGAACRRDENCPAGYVCCSGACQHTEVGCGEEPCTLGLARSCASCDHDCTLSVLNATAVCDNSAGTAVCNYTGECAPDSADADGNRSNGCEAVCAPSNGGVETCDGIDNDCNGTPDDMARAAIDAECDALFPDSHVATWTCAAGACDISACDAGAWNNDDSIANGCEYDCLATGSETCNGADDDCNGRVDDVASIETECTALYGHPQGVLGFACVLGACTVDVCEAGTIDHNGSPEDGCELTCTPTTPADEVCDGVDNDCNDEIDDGLMGCGCTGGASASVEVCFDAIDNDCDADVDEGCSCNAGESFCDVDGRTAHVCNASGTTIDPALDTDCGFLCAGGTCQAAANSAPSDVLACDLSAPPLRPTGGSTVLFGPGGIVCTPDCGDGATTLIDPIATYTSPDARDARLFCLSSVDIPAGVTLTAEASQTEAMILVVAGDVVIDGVVLFDGEDALPPIDDTPGGRGGPGGWDGADTGCPGCGGSIGDGPGGGGGGSLGTELLGGGGGGGGGHGGWGGGGGSPDPATDPAGPGAPYAGNGGSEPLTPLTGGSGGGSGSGGYMPGGAGGGGGGALQISARGVVEINGSVSARGGRGADSILAGGLGGGGGGGAGGGVLIQARQIVIGGTIAVDGGDGGSTKTAAGGAGANGTAFDGANGEDAMYGGGGGGGGGGGRVLLQAASMPDCASVSPEQACIGTAF